MPDFHRSMKESLRSPDQGADTVVWLAISEVAITNPSGRFYQGMLRKHFKELETYLLVSECTGINNDDL